MNTCEHCRNPFIVSTDPVFTDQRFCSSWCRLEHGQLEHGISRGHDPSVWWQAVTEPQPTTKRKLNMNISVNEDIRYIGIAASITAALVLIVVYITSCSIKTNLVSEQEKTKRFEMVNQKLITNMTITVVKPE